MKRILTYITITIIATISMAAKSPVSTGDSFCELGMFVIEKSETPLIVGWKIMETYTLTYENSDMEVRIAIDDTDKKCRRFIVFAENICVQYMCDGKIFGSSIPEKISVNGRDRYTIDNLNKEEYFRQKVITQNQFSEIDQMKLIGVYFPKLVNEYQVVFAVK